MRRCIVCLRGRPVPESYTLSLHDALPILGAKRGRLIRQLLTEGFLLVTIGGVLGCAGGFSATRILRELIPASLPASIRLDLRIFGFSAAISAAALLAFGLVPAWIASRTDVNETLK